MFSNELTVVENKKNSEEISWQVDIDFNKILEKSAIVDKVLISKMEEIFNVIKPKINNMNKNLSYKNLTLFKHNKKSVLNFLEIKERNFSMKNIDSVDKISIMEIFKEIKLILLKCSPPARVESEDEKISHIARERYLHNSQLNFNKNSEILSNFKKLSPFGGQVYLMHAWDDSENIPEREKWIYDSFLPNLEKHCKQAGVDLIWQHKNFIGSNLDDFFKKISDSQHILVLGTESLRQQCISNDFAMACQKEILLKRISKPTSLITYVLTGIRETAFSDEFTDITTPNWRDEDYQSILIGILCRVYGIGKDTFLKKVVNKQNENPPSTSRNPFTTFSVNNKEEEEEEVVEASGFTISNSKI